MRLYGLIGRLIAVLLSIPKRAKGQHGVVQSISPGETWSSINLIKNQMYGFLLKRIDISPRGILDDGAWKVEISVPYDSTKMFKGKSSIIKRHLYPSKDNEIRERNKIKIIGDSIALMIFDKINHLVVSKADIVGDEIKNHRTIYSLSEQLIDFDIEITSDEIFTIKFVQEGIIGVKGFLLVDYEMFAKRDNHLLRITVISSPSITVQQIIIYKKNHNFVWLLVFQNGVCVRSSKHDMKIKISGISLVLHRFLIISSFYNTTMGDLSNRKLLIEYNILVTLDSDLFPNFPTKEPQPLAYGRLTYSDSLGDSGRMRLFFVELIYGIESFAVSLNVIYYDALFNDVIQTEHSTAYEMLKTSYSFETALSWVNRDYSIHYIYLKDNKSNQICLKWTTFLDSMTSILISGSTNSPKFIRYASSKHGILELNEDPNPIPSSESPIAILRILKQPYIKISLLEEPLEGLRHLNASITLSNVANKMDVVINISLHYQKIGLFEGGIDKIRLKQTDTSVVNINQFQSYPLEYVIEGSFIMEKEASQKNLNYFDYIRSNKTALLVDKYMASGFFDIKFQKSSVAESLQSRIESITNSNDYSFLIISKYAVYDYFIFESTNGEEKTAPLTSQKIQAGFGAFKKSVYYKGFLFILDSLNQIHMIHLRDRNIKKVELPGKVCEDIAILYPESIPPIFFCYTKGIEFSLFYASELVKERNLKGMIRYSINGSLNEYRDRRAIILTSDGFGDKLYLLFNASANSYSPFPSLLSLKLEIQEYMKIVVTDIPLNSLATRMNSRRGSIIDSITINTKILVLFQIETIQTIIVCEMMSSEYPQISNMVEINPFLVADSDAKFYKIGDYSEANLDPIAKLFEGVVLQVKSPFGWNLIYIDPFQHQSNIVSTFILPVDSKYKFVITKQITINSEFVSIRIKLEFADPNNHNFESCSAEFAIPKPMVGLRMVREAIVQHHTMMQNFFKDIKEETRDITLLNRKSKAGLVVKLKATFLSQTDFLELRDRKNSSTSDILLDKRLETIMLQSTITRGSVFKTEYIFEEHSDLVYSRATIIPFYERLNKLEVASNGRIICLEASSKYSDGGILLTNEGYIFISEISLLKNSSSTPQIKDQIIKIDSMNRDNCRLAIVMENNYIVDVCAITGSIIVRRTHLQRLSIEEFRIEMVMEFNSAYKIRSLKNWIVCSRISRRGGALVIYFIELPANEMYQGYSEGKVVYSTPTDSKIELNISHKNKLSLFEIRLKLGVPIISLSIIPDITRLERNLNLDIFLETIFQHTLTLEYLNLCRHPNDIEINEGWDHLLSESILLYFIDFRGQRSRVLALSTTKKGLSVIVELHNPFIAMEQHSMIPPICKYAICIAASIFSDTSYLKIYHIPPNIISEFTKVHSEGAESINAGPKVLSEIVYTHAVINVSSVITGLNWDPSHEDSSQSLTFFIFTKRSIEYYRINLNEGIVLTGDLQSMSIKAEFKGAFSRNISHRFVIRNVSLNDRPCNIIGVSILLLVGVIVIVLNYLQIGDGVAKESDTVFY